MSRVIRECIGFALLLSCDWLKNSRLAFNQSDAKLIPIAIWSPAFSRALGGLVVFTLSSRWLFQLFSFLLIGRCDYFGFGFMTLNRKVLFEEKSAESNFELIIEGNLGG